MGFSCATGVLSVNTGAVTTNYSVTGVSPSDGTWKAVLLWWSGRADVADAAGEQDIQPGFGAAVSSTGRWTATGQSDHSPTTTATDRYQSDAACVAVLDINGAVVGLADFVSFNSDGFTLVVDDQFPALVRVSYMLLGGTDLSDAAVGQFQLSAGTGLFDAVTSLGFQPDCAFFGSVVNGSSPPAATTENVLSIGAAISSAAQAVLSFRSDNGVGTSASRAYCRAGEIIAQPQSGGVNPRVSFDSFLSNGFKLNQLESGGTQYVSYLALKGGTYKLGDFLTQTNTTAFTEATGLSAAPKGAMFFSACRAQDASDTSTTQATMSIGAATSGSSRNAQAIQDKTASNNADCFSAIEHDAIYINPDVGTTQAIEGICDLNSFDANGDMTLQMDDADPAQSFVWYVAFGDRPILTGAGAAAGTGTATGVGKSTWKAAGAAAGTSTVTADGQSTNKAAGSASATSTAEAEGQSVKAGTGAAAGTSTATATGKSTWKAAGSAAGAATVTADAQSTNKAAGAASSAATVAAIARAFALAGGSSQAISTAEAIAQAINMAIASSVSTSNVAGVLQNIAEAETHTRTPLYAHLSHKRRRPRC
jgi:hypothetical protein